MSRHGAKDSFEGKRAVGVNVKIKGKDKTFKGNEIICCGGAINSPHLLQLSGIGNPDHLSPLGIDMVHASPGVGEDLQDHLEVYIQYASKKPVSLYPALKWWRAPWIGFQWLFMQGMGRVIILSGRFIRGNDRVAY